jgi:hypothetical protein
VAIGLLVCIATLAALEWPPARFAVAAPALWLGWSSRTTGDAAAAVVEISSGAALLVLALFTAVSMALVTAGFGLTLTARPVAGAVAAAAPALGCLSLAFGIWYAAAAWSLAPYPL